MGNNYCTVIVFIVCIMKCFGNTFDIFAYLAFFFFKQCILCWYQNFNTWPSSLTILKKEKAKFKVAVRKYLNTHSFYSVDKYFMCKDDQ